MNNNRNKQAEFLTEFLKRGKRISLSQMPLDRLAARVRREEVLPRPRIWIKLEKINVN